MKVLWMAGLLILTAALTIASTEPEKKTWQEKPADVQKLPLLLPLGDKRTSRTDLELSGDLPGSSAYAGRYVAYSELLKLPQVTFTVTDDPNFPGKADLGGIPLDELAQALHIPEGNTLVAVDCDDKYEGHYSADYRAAHHPILVLTVNGQPLPITSRTADGGAYGPYLISHRTFVSRYQILAHAEESQIPNGVIELRFLNEDKVLAAIRPQGSFSAGSPQMQGYVIARENCFRCHNAGAYGGRKAGITWGALGKIARTKPAYFGAYIKDPGSESAYAEMPGFPEYDDATLAALTAYFQAFAPNPASNSEPR